MKKEKTSTALVAHADYRVKCFFTNKTDHLRMHPMRDDDGNMHGFVFVHESIGEQTINSLKAKWAFDTSGIPSEPSTNLQPTMVTSPHQ